jgi:hypothetical protein
MVQWNRKKSGVRLWSVIITLLVIALAVWFLVWNAYSRENKSGENEDSGVGTVKWEDDNIDNNDGMTTTVEDEQVEKKKVVQYEGEDPNLTEELSGVVSYAGKLGDDITIRVIIDQYLREGNCVLELTNGDVVVYSKAANVVPMVSTSSCDGFDMPFSELGSGVFGITVKVEAGEKTGVILGEINI